MPSGAPDGPCGRSAPPQCRTAATAPHRGRRGSYRHGREDKIYSLASPVQLFNIIPDYRVMVTVYATPLVFGLFSEPIVLCYRIPVPSAIPAMARGAVSTNQLVRKEETGFSSPCPADIRNNSTLRGAPVNPSRCDIRLTSEHDSRNALNRTGARSTGRTATTPMTRGARPQELAARQRIQC